MAQNDLVTHFPFGITSRGMPVIGGGGRETTGNVYFVSSTASGRSDNVNTHGGNPTTPFATLDFAIGACTAGRGDIIYVMPGHAETITSAGGIDPDVQGISIIGLGVGRKRPIFTFSSSTSASVTIDDANIRIENCVFDFTGVDGLLIGFDINAADFQLVGCELIFASASNQTVQVIVGDGNAHRLLIQGNRFLGAAAAGTLVAINMPSACTDLRIEDNIFVGDFTTACIAMTGSVVYTNVLILRNTIVTLGTSQKGFNIVGTGCTGVIGYNAITGTNLASLLNNSSGIANVENYGYDSDSTDQVGVLVPLVGSQILVSNFSLYDLIIGNQMIYNRINFLETAADLTSATWNTAASHEVFTVTGTVRVRIIAVCTADVTSGGAITFEFGTETTSAAFIASTDGTTIDAGMFWLGTTPSHQFATTSVIDRVITGGKDIGYTIGTNAATGGGITFYCWWEPLTSDGIVTAGGGGSL